GVETYDAAAAKLGEALGDRRVLLVIDDVWSERDLRRFLHGGAKTTRLITTRIDRELPATGGLRSDGKQGGKPFQRGGPHRRGGVPPMGACAVV
ncbi:MAG: NB-ARC domain-containing protein, partial [Hyphomicrobiaceae bacterium]